METFSALLAICAGNSPVPGEFPTQRPVTRSFDVYFDLHLNKRLCKQSWGWWFVTLLCPLWRHSNVKSMLSDWWVSVTSSACHRWNVSHKHVKLEILLFKVATVGRKNSLTFPWHFPDCQHKFQSLSRYIPCGEFLQYIQNQIEITLFINIWFNIVVLKIGQHKRTFSTTWKLSISCAEHYAKHENK